MGACSSGLGPRMRPPTLILVAACLVLLHAPLAGAFAPGALLRPASEARPRVATFPPMELRSSIRIQLGAARHWHKRRTCGAVPRDLTGTEAAVVGVAAKAAISHTGAILLAFTIIFELAGATCLKLSSNFTNPVMSVALCVFYGLSFYFFTRALLHFPLSLAYAIWSGVMTAATTLIGVYVFGEIIAMKQWMGIATIMVGVLLVNS